ncbi:unnamed protein product [Hermetia illucens]|uniref:N-acetyltransferase domain-containing protein n=1 Tax=Hermetia illucens TaxID=343691 RepID=A0A7R8V4B8_HERIL|nr:uncharacterized protein LOC119659195 isoform X1 [Hermetia illucens]CAD7092443.1 unnamed protein product [Hermetia illucens]
MADKLVDIPIQDLTSLRDLYREDWPKYNIGYGTVDTYVRWLNKDPNIPHIRILSLNGDWSDGTFIITDWISLYANTRSTDFTRLVKALSLVDWSKGYTIASIGSRLLDLIYKFVKENNVDVNYIKGTKWFRMPQDEAAKLIVNPPDGITLRPLTAEDVVTANALWPFRRPGSLIYLQRLAKYNVSVGAFTSDGELVAWCFRIPVGSLGTLQVAESHKRKGFGSLIVRAMAKAIGETGYDVFAPVVFDNYPSLNMFEKLGFKVVDTMNWLPPAKPGNWHDNVPHY